MKSAGVDKLQKLQGNSRTLLKGFDDVSCRRPGLYRVTQLEQDQLVCIEFFFLDDMLLSKKVPLLGVASRFLI